MQRTSGGAGVIILASHSAARRAMLDAAGVPFTAVAANIDEDAVKASLDIGPRDLADALAEMKAVKVSLAHPADLVLGSDSLVALADGTILDKPSDRAEAADHLRRMSGGRHAIWSAAVIAEAGGATWRHVEAARLHVRTLPHSFIEAYLDAEWPAIAGCVGCFRVEGAGVQLFDRIEGSHFTVLGLPLLPVLAQLRVRGVMMA